MFSEMLHLWLLAYSMHRTLLQILQDTDDDEIEFDKTGSWKPVEKSKRGTSMVWQIVHYGYVIF